MSKAKDNRKLTHFRAQPDTVRRIEQWCEADGCRSRNEFIERAVAYYTDAPTHGAAGVARALRRRGQCRSARGNG